MAINFPSTSGQLTDGSFTHTNAGVTWSWDGVTWNALGVSSTGAVETLDSVTGRGNIATSAILANGGIEIQSANNKLQFGANNFQIWRDTSTATTVNYIIAQSEPLTVRASELTLQAGTNSYKALEAETGGAVKLYWTATNTGNLRLSTTNTGVAVTGSLSATGAVSGSNINATNWDTAYSWGDHSGQGYLTSLGGASGVTAGKITQWDTAYGWGNHSGQYILTTHAANSVTSAYVTNWNSAYGWGDHSTEGYIKSNVGSLTIGGNGTTGGVTISDGSVAIRTGTGNVAAIDLYCESSNAHKVTVKAPPHSSFSGNVNFQLPGDNGTSGYVLKTDGSGNTSWVQQSGGIGLASLSVSQQAVGTAGLTYDNTTGQFTYTPPDLSSYLTSYTEQDNINTVTGRGGTTSNSVVFGGDGSTNGIYLNNGVISAKSSTGTSSKIEIYSNNNNQYKVTLQAPLSTDFSGNTTFTLPGTNGSNGQVLTSDGSGNTSWSTLSGGGGGASVTVNDNAPSSPSNGDLWWNSNAGQLKIWYDDGLGTPSAQWVDAAGGGGSSGGTGVTQYAGVANFPSASTSEGQLAYANDVNSLYYSNGSGWSSGRIVTTNNASSSDFSTLLGNYQKTYAFSINDHTQGTTAENNKRKVIKLVDNIGTDAGKFTVHASAGIGIATTTDSWSNTSLDLTVDPATVHNYTVVGVDVPSAAADSILRIQDSIRSISSDITFKGADGLKVEYTDANTLTFRNAPTATQYTDDMAKAAAGVALQNGTHQNISFTWNSANKTIDATASGGGGSGGNTYDLSGRNTTAANAFIDLVPATGSTDSIEFIGSNGTDVAWDGLNNRITINSKDYTVGANATASGGGGLSLTGSTFTYTPPNLASFLTSVPQASASVVGGIKVGTGLTMDAATGVLSANAGGYTLPTAGTGAGGDLGGVKVDGSTITIDANSVISSSGGSTVPSIGTVNATSTSIADNDRGDLTIVGHEGYVLYKIESSHEAWIRLYVDNTTRQADKDRSEGHDPAPGSGVVAECRTSGANESVLVTPGVMGFNNDSPARTQNIYVSINNRSGSAATITVTLTVLKIGE